MINLKLKKALGIDIDENKISAVEIVSDRGSLKVRRSGTVPTPSGALSRGAVTDPKAVAKAIEALFKSSRMSARGQRVIASLPGSCCVARLTGLPGGGPMAVREHIQDEIKRYAVFSGERTVSDFVLTGRAEGAGGGRIAFLAAAREESAEVLVETLTGARIAPRAIDISPLAVARALHHGVHSPGVRSAVVYAVPEHDAVHLMVFNSMGLLFSHTARERVDFSGSSPEAAARMASIVRTVLDFYDTEIGNVNEVEKVVVVSDGDLPQTVRDDIGRTLDEVGVVFSSSSTAIRDSGLVAEADVGPTSLCAIGLALRAFDDARFRLDLSLLPAAAARAQEFKRRLTIAAIAAVGLFLLSLLGAGGIFLGQQSIESESLDLQTKIDSVALSPEMLEAREEVATLQTLLECEREFLDSPGPAVSWLALFENVKEIIPHDVRLLRLEDGGEGEIFIEGESYSVDSVYRFAEPFNTSVGVNSAKLSNLSEIEREGEALVGFTMDCELQTLGQERGEGL